MKNKSWKTTLFGLLTFIAPILHVIFPQTISADTVILINGALTGLGLTQAKDGNVTGGTIQQ